MGPRTQTSIGLEGALGYIARRTPVIGRVLHARDEHLEGDSGKYEKLRRKAFQQYLKFLAPLAIFAVIGANAFVYSSNISQRLNPRFYSRDEYIVNRSKGRFRLDFYRFEKNTHKYYKANIEINREPRLDKISYFFIEDNSSFGNFFNPRVALGFGASSFPKKNTSVSIGSEEYDRVQEFMHGFWEENPALRRYFPKEFGPEN